MIIQVSPNVRINMEDPKNYTLEKRRVVQEGKNAGVEQWDALGYYGSLKSAAGALLHRHFSLLAKDLDQVKDLKSLIGAIDEGAFLIAQALPDAPGGNA